MKIDNISHLLYSLVRNDKDKIESAFACCIADENSVNIKNTLTRILDEYHYRQGMAVVEKLEPAIKLMVNAPYKDCSFDDLLLSDDILQDTERILLEWQHRDGLIENGLLPSNKILLEGPPGNGKTSYATALAKKLGLPILVTNSSLILDQYLGKSEQNISLLFNHLPESCVLFFDEFEALVSSRGRISEDSGGAGRAWNSVVTSFLVNMERLRPSVLFIAATNRTDMMDKAVLRRFDMRLDFENPSDDDKGLYVQKYLRRYGLDAGMFMKEKTAKKIVKAISFSALESVLQKRHKEIILGKLIGEFND